MSSSEDNTSISNERTTESTSGEVGEKSRGLGPKGWAIVGICIALAVLVGVVVWTNANSSNQSTTTSLVGSDTGSLLTTTSEGDGVQKDPSVSQVGEPPVTTVAEGELPNKDINPLAAGIDPCKVLSQGDVQGVVGKVAASRPTGGGTGCEYPSDGGSKVVVSVVRGDSAAKYDATLKDVRQQSSDTLKLLDGVGDAGFAYETPGVLASAEARRGELRYRVVVVGEGAKREQCESLLRKAVLAKHS